MSQIDNQLCWLVLILDFNKFLIYSVDLSFYKLYYAFKAVYVVDKAVVIN